FPIEEQSVPRSDLPGESTWPTQPLPVKPAPFARQLFTAEDITDITPEAHKAVLEQFVKLRPHTLFMPPSREGTIILPGFDGGAEWGGAAVDPAKGILYVNANEMPWILTMVDVKSQEKGSSGQAIYNQICAVCHGPNRSGDPARAFPSLEKIGEKMKEPDIIQLISNGKGMMPSFAFFTSAQKESVAAFLLGKTETSTNRFGANEEPAGTDVLGRKPFTTPGYKRWPDPKGYPATKPPWGTLNAIDLNTGEYVWRTTLGELPELTAQGIPPTGTENYGGPIATAGGLI